MHRYLENLSISSESNSVLEEGKNIWTEFFRLTDVRSIREELKLERPDIGWWQIRNAIKHRNDSGDFKEYDMGNFKESYRELSNKIRPKVFEYGFLKE